MAESEGFEPPIDLRLCLISSQVHSTGLCQLSDLSSLEHWSGLDECGGGIARVEVAQAHLGSDKLRLEQLLLTP
jgi:hypothetical protein